MFSRQIKRHTSNIGSLMLLGTGETLLIPDAKFRSIKSFVEWGSDFFEMPKPKIETGYLTGYPDDSEIALPYNISDVELRDRFSDADFTKDLLEFQSPACLYCQNLKIGSIHGFALPNIAQLAAIYLESDRLDALDPTIEEYPAFALGFRNPNGRFCFSSASDNFLTTEFASSSGFNLDCAGWIYKISTGEDKGVIPIKILIEP